MSHPPIILLTMPELAPFAAKALGPFVSRPVFDLEGLRAAVAPPTKAGRVISFASSVIVPPDLLAALPGPAYNFHPGPPEYRGLFPSVFALYEGATWFGVTLHEMAAELDAGPIIAVDRFAVPVNADRLALDTLTLEHMLAMLERLAPQLADPATRLLPTRDVWSGQPRRKPDFDALCKLPANVTADEFARRYRAIGEGPHHALEIEIFGQRFKLDNKRDGDVVRAGQRSARQPTSAVASPRIVSK